VAISRLFVGTSSAMTARRLRDSTIFSIDSAELRFAEPAYSLCQATEPQRHRERQKRSLPGFPLCLCVSVARVPILPSPTTARSC
jgi:hypothetical protein